MAANRPVLSILTRSALALAALLGSAGVAAAQMEGAAAATAAPTAAEQTQLHAEQRLWDTELLFEAADQRVNAASADVLAAEEFLSNAVLAGRSVSERERLQAQIERAQAKHSWLLAKAAAAKADFDRARGEIKAARQALEAERASLATTEALLETAAPAAPAEAS